MACSKCLSNEILNQIAMLKGSVKRCQDCGARKGIVLSDAELAPMIRNLLQAYSEVDASDPLRQGDPIERLLQADWTLFSDVIAENPDRLKDVTHRLLRFGEDPKDDNPDYNAEWVPEAGYLETTWHEACVGLLVDGTPLSFDDLNAGAPNVMEIVFEDLSTEVPTGAVFYRARIHQDQHQLEPFSEAEMLAPPPDKVRPGRANREGQPVLYLSDSPETCIAEVRPWKAAAVAKARVALSRPCRILDLVRKTRIPNPFADELLRWKVQLSALLDRLSFELSLPVAPNDRAAGYRVTQELCRLVREAGYDGLKYLSSVAAGSNVVLFDTNVARVMDIDYCAVESIAYTTRPTGSIPSFPYSPYDVPDLGKP